MPCSRSTDPPVPDGKEPISVRIASGIDAVPAEDWDACAGDGNPFVSHAFLKALEDGGAVGADTGWLPQHLVVEDDEGRVSGVAPLYARGDSYGEYVFDHGWAHAYERAGGRYYPKLLCGVPFSPVPGPRLLVRPGEFAGQARAALASAMIEVARRSGLSSVHVNFLPKEEWDYLGELGFLKRLGQQYHWYNDGYRSFDDFLAALNSRKRKTIRKERRTLEEWGLTFEALTGDDLREEHWDLFHRFYRNTVDRKWGGAYLTRDFFFRLHETMADRTVLIVGRREDRIVCGALNMRGADTLYGRNWGCDTRFRFLHFEACYYQAIDYAIREGLQRVEAGAQGQHKIQRGYVPVETYSAHWIADRNFRRAVADYLERERDAVGDEIEFLADFTPFRKEG